mmetsp:Transcript_14329/g.26038  ORF Transcript_14329/g.26038 Transcript_14329/m.26038 type:complete len:95 (-) Transcript_14329:99-383(-)
MRRAAAEHHVVGRGTTNPHADDAINDTTASANTLMIVYIYLFNIELKNERHSRNKDCLLDSFGLVLLVTLVTLVGSNEQQSNLTAEMSDLITNK